MNLSKEADRVRYSYVEGMVQRTTEALNNLEPAFGLPLAELSAALGRVVVPNIVDGSVVVPREYQTDSEAVMVTALSYSEHYRLGEGFYRRTPAQYSNALAEIKKWKPTELTGEEILEAQTNNLAEDGSSMDRSSSPLEVGLRKGQAAAIRVVAPMHDLREAEKHFKNPPKARLAQFVMRPLIVLGNDGEKPLTEDMFIHELVHYVDKVVEPVRVIKSQKASDMLSLNDELRAYRAGAVVAMHLDKTQLSNFDKHENLNIQVAIDLLRLLHNGNGLDAFRPSPNLLRELESKVGTILHDRLPYDDIVQGFNEECAQS